MYYFPKKITFNNMHSDILEINCTIMQFQSVMSKTLSCGEEEGSITFTKNLKSLTPVETHLHSYWSLKKIAFQ